MKRLLMIPLALLGACAASGSSAQEESEMIRRINVLEAKNNSAVAFYEDLSKKVVDLHKRLSDLSNQFIVLQTANADLESRLKAGAAAAPAVVGDGGPPADENAIRKTELTLKALKSGEADETTTIRELFPFARVAAPLVMEELRRNLISPKYAPTLERVLSTLPVDAVRGSVAEAAKSREMLAPVSRIVGALGDLELSKILAGTLASADEDLRLEIASALVKCKNPDGLLPLVNLLRSEKWDIRMLAIDALKKINRGADYGFNARASAAENEAAVAKWKTWQREFGPNLFNP